MKTNTLLAVMAIASLAACGSGGGPKGAQTAPTPTPVEVAAKVALSIVIPAAVADEAPGATVYTVKVTGKSSATKEIPAGKTSITLEGLDIGDYTVEVTAKVGADIVATGTATTTLTKNTASIQVPVKYIKASLLVEAIPTIETASIDNLSGKYSATAKMSGCIKNTFTGAFGVTDANVTVQIKDLKAKVTLELFPKTLVEINGDLAANTIAGTYSASTDPNSLGNISQEIENSQLAIDLRTPIGQTPPTAQPVKETPNAGAFSSGTATVGKIILLDNGGIYLSINLKGECETSINISGFRS